MNLLPEMQHVEVIVLSGIIAVTVFAVVTAVVSTAVYFATRERTPQSVPSRSAVPVLPTPAAEPARSSTMVAAG